MNSTRRDPSLSVDDQAEPAALSLTAWLGERGFEWQGFHRYTNLDGSPIYWRIRWKNLTTGKKEMRPMRLNGERFELFEPEAFKVKGAKKPLYNLRQHALRPDALHVLVEGERVADMMQKFLPGAVIMTSGNWSSYATADFEPLRLPPQLYGSCDFEIWPDRDEQGEKFSQGSAEILRSLGWAVKQIDVSKLDIEDGEDFVDWQKKNPDATVEDYESLPRIDPPQQQP